MGGLLHKLMEPKSGNVVGLQKGPELASEKTSEFSPAFTFAFLAHLFHSAFWNSFIFFFFFFFFLCRWNFSTYPSACWNMRTLKLLGFTCYSFSQRQSHHFWFQISNSWKREPDWSSMGHLPIRGPAGCSQSGRVKGFKYNCRDPFLQVVRQFWEKTVGQKST